MRLHWPSPDFVRHARPVPLLAWSVLAVGAAVLAVALGDWLDRYRALEEARLDLARLEVRLRTVSAPRSTALVSVSRADLSLESVRALRRVEQQLQRPWERVFLGLERASAPGVRWLTLEIDSEGTRVRAEGIAPSSEAALAVVDGLAVDAGWTDVVLTRLQAADAGGAPTSGASARGAADQRFEVAARWATTSASPPERSAMPVQRP